jgi:biopolymer transport protein ExbB/TolQ
LTGEVLDKFAQLITTALGLVAALARNTAIQNLFDKVFGKAEAALAGQYLYAILITFVLIFATIAVSRAAERAKKAEVERQAPPNRDEDRQTIVGAGFKPVQGPKPTPKRDEPRWTRAERERVLPI